MKKILLFLLLISVSPVNSSAQVVKLSISTEPQNIPTDAVSEKITVSAQNAAGEPIPITETAHLLLESSSPSGQFSSSGSNWKAVTMLTMSKNTANRSFYFRDSVAGTVTITVSPGDGQTWGSASQTIVIGGEKGNDSTSIGAEKPKTTNTAALLSSAHTGAADLSKAEEAVLSIGAGRPRLVAVGNPVEFRAAGEIEGTKFSWSFGDGSVRLGAEADHIYLFAGEYNVVLYGKAKGREAIARTKVRVVEPSLSFGRVDPKAGFVEIKNNATEEVNLYGWTLYCDDNKYEFPRDLIVSAQSALRLPLSVAKCPKTASIWTIRATDRVLADYRLPTRKPIDPAEVDRLGRELDWLNRLVNALPREELGQAAVVDTIINSPTLPETTVVSSTEPASEGTTIILDNSPKKNAWWKRFIPLFVK